MSSLPGYLTFEMNRSSILALKVRDPQRGHRCMERLMAEKFRKLAILEIEEVECTLGYWNPKLSHSQFAKGRCN